MPAAEDVPVEALPSGLRMLELEKMHQCVQTSGHLSNTTYNKRFTMEIPETRSFSYNVVSIQATSIQGNSIHIILMSTEEATRPLR